MRLLSILLVAALWSGTAGAEPLKVIASFSILGDITQEIGGAYIQLTTMVGPDSDAHVYETTPHDAKQVIEADLIVKNGLYFEPWLDRLILSTGTKAPVCTASRGIIPRKLQEDNLSIPDPHAWNNLANAIVYAQNIAAALSAADPEHTDQYARNLNNYVQQIEQLLAQTRAQFEDIPNNLRRVVTSHDAFGYLGQAYGIEFIAPQGLSTEHEPSAKEVAQLIEQIRREHITAVFIENIKDPRLLKQIAEETAAQIGGVLYSDALASSGPASTYLGLYRYNVATLSKALTPAAP